MTNVIQETSAMDVVLLEDFAQQNLDAYLGAGCEWDAKCNCEDDYDEEEDW